MFKARSFPEYEAPVIHSDDGNILLLHNQCMLHVDKYISFVLYTQSNTRARLREIKKERKRERERDRERESTKYRFAN